MVKQSQKIDFHFLDLVSIQLITMLTADTGFTVIGDFTTEKTFQQIIKTAEKNKYKKSMSTVIAEVTAGRVNACMHVFGWLCCFWPRCVCYCLDRYSFVETQTTLEERFHMIYGIDALNTKKMVCLLKKALQVVAKYPYVLHQIQENGLRSDLAYLQNQNFTAHDQLILKASLPFLLAQFSNDMQNADRFNQIHDISGAYQSIHTEL